MPEIHSANFNDGFVLFILVEEICCFVFSNSVIDSCISCSFIDNTDPKTFKIVYKNPVKETRGECNCGIFRYSILFFLQYVSIFPPDENAIMLQPDFLEESNTDRTSTVLPE